MTPHQQKMMLHAASAGGLVMGALVVVWGLFWPVTPVVTAPESPVLSMASPATVQSPLVTGSPQADPVVLKQLAARHWRRPLFPEPGSEEDASMAEGGAGSPLSLRLVGVVHEPGHSMALFQKPDGQIEVCPQNQTVDDVGGQVKVTRVEPDRVTILYRGESQVLMLPLPEQRTLQPNTPGVAGSTGATRRPLPPQVEQRLQQLRASRGLPPVGTTTSPAPTPPTESSANPSATPSSPSNPSSPTATPASEPG